MSNPQPHQDFREVDDLVNQLLDQHLSDADANRLNALLASSREAVARYRQLLDTHQAICDLYPGDVFHRGLDHDEPSVQAGPPGSKDRRPRPVIAWIGLGIAGCVLGLLGYTIGEYTTSRRGDAGAPAAEFIEGTLAGHAVLRQAVEVAWPEHSPAYQAGSLLPAGNLAFASGIAVIDFFCGATLVVEGPARLEILSDWAVTVHDGRLEATIPAAAQGFVVNAVDTEIIDLGTRFALDLSGDAAQVAVLDGEILVRGKAFEDQLLRTGDAAALADDPLDPSFVSHIPRLDAVEARADDNRRQRFTSYRSFAETLARDPRLIAFYPAAATITGRRLVNAAATPATSDGQLIGPAEVIPGRFAQASAGVSLSRPGSRVRTKIDGTFSAFTFACWARIDSLQHTYNALFLADGYENGEPHWQIRQDGRLMFSVMVDEDRELTYPRGPGRPPLPDAGFHRVYFSEPVWNTSMSGRWLHLAAVYDPQSRQVIQFLDGQEVCREEITDAFFIADLSIGAAEIGNWGQPFRTTPEFAVRNLDGAIDEMIIFDAALSGADIQNLYRQGTPDER